MAYAGAVASPEMWLRLLKYLQGNGLNVVTVTFLQRMLIHTRLMLLLLLLLLLLLQLLLLFLSALLLLLFRGPLRLSFCG